MQLLKGDCTMTLEEFKEWFKTIEEYNEEWEKANEAIQVLCPGTYAMLEIGNGLLDSYTALLEKMMGSEGDWIAYYLYECESGKKPMGVVLENGREILLDSIEKLYEIMMEERL
jgi:hypothetical protein